MIKFVCPSCAKELSVKDEAAGKGGKCPKCQNVIIVPSAHGDLAPQEPIEDMEAGLRKAIARVESEAMEVACPTCGHKSSFGGHRRGSKVMCPSCHSDVMVPPLRQRPEVSKETGELKPIPNSLPSGQHGTTKRENICDPSFEAKWLVPAWTNAIAGILGTIGIIAAIGGGGLALICVLVLAMDAPFGIFLSAFLSGLVLCAIATALNHLHFQSTLLKEMLRRSPEQETGSADDKSISSPET